MSPVISTTEAANVGAFDMSDTTPTNIIRDLERTSRSSSDRADLSNKSSKKKIVVKITPYIISMLEISPTAAESPLKALVITPPPDTIRASEYNDDMNSPDINLAMPTTSGPIA